jgi:hypothetical protein
MLPLLLQSRTTHAVLIIRRVSVIGRNIRTYKSPIQQLHHDGIDYKQQSIEINPVDVHYRKI